MRITGPLAVGILGSFCALCPGQAFQDVTSAAGITHNAIAPNSSTSPTFAQVQAGGAAAGDFDGDGWVDLYVTRYFDTDLLYRNNGNGTFNDVTATAFPEGVGNRETSGAAWGDIDNDGDLDLAVSTLNESRHLLYINNGSGEFTEEGESRNLLIETGLPTTSGTSFSMGDYDRDGYLDMYVTEWRDFSGTSSAVQARLFHNLGSVNPGHFEDVTAAAGVAMDIASGIHAGKGLSFTPRFVDFDRDGYTDIAITSDGRTSRLFWNEGDGTFVDGTQLAGINTGTNDMGFTVGDFNGDGLMDWFVTSIGLNTGEHPSGNRLFLNNGDRTFSDATNSGVREGGWGWGAEALDFDNDGDLDIAMTNGMTFIADDRSFLFQNVGTRTDPQFVDQSTLLGITDTGQGRGLLDFDYDQDGDLDLYIVNYHSAPILYRNDTSHGNAWLQIETVGTQSNRDGIGTLITVTPDTDHPEVFYLAEIDGSSNYLAQSEALAHFGLGDASTIDELTVLWPSGYKQVFSDVAINQRLTIVEGLVSDFDNNDRVDWLDLEPWQGNYGSSNATSEQGDADRDHDVDGFDFLHWQQQVGLSTVSGIVPNGAVTRISEPTSAVNLVVAIGMLCLGVRRSSVSRRINSQPR